MDFRTLFLLHSVVSLTCSASLVALASIFPRQPGSRLWALAMGQITLGLVCLVGFSEAGWWLLAVLGNWLPISGFLSLARATQQAAGRTPLNASWRLGWLVVIALVLGYITLAHVAPSPSGHTAGQLWFDRRAYFSSMLVSAAIATTMLIMARDIWLSGCHRLPFWSIYSACTVLMLVAATVRLLLSIGFGPDAAESLQVLNSTSFLVTTVGLIGFTIGAILITAGRLNSEITAMAERDALTGLLNRHGFFARYRAWSSERSTMSLSLVLIDIDHFKCINDQHGHDVGDAVIGRLAALLTEGVRRSDWVARFGGEEFVVALPDTAQAEALELADRLRGAIEREGLQHAGARLHFTASFGVAQGRADSPFETLFKAADRALYAAKHQGRNRVHIAAMP